MTITVEAIKAMREDEGLTLKGYDTINYKTGYQVATEGTTTTEATEAMQQINNYKGNCGVWYNKGIYYIDKSHRVSTKREAIKEGKEHNQISIYCWKNKNKKLAYC